MAFVNQGQVKEIMEDMIRNLFQEVLDFKLQPFLQISYEECMKRFGSDRPHLGIDMELIDVGDLMKDVEFKVFSQPANDEESRVACLVLKNKSDISRKQIDDYTEFVSNYGATGLAYIRVNAIKDGVKGMQSPILKFLDEDCISSLIDRLSIEDGDTVFFGADKAEIVNASLGALRERLATDFNLIQPGWHPLWVTDFPMFHWEPKEKRWASEHHPFTSPLNDDPKELTANPKTAISLGYDMVLNGNEIGGGSIRIHSQEMQSAVFKPWALAPKRQVKSLDSFLKH